MENNENISTEAEGDDNVEKSFDETDAKNFVGKFFGEKAENKIEPVLDKSDDIEFEKLKIKEEEDDKLIDFRVTTKDEYPDGCSKRGICLIIENDMFHTNLGLSKRKGSSVDRQLMIDTFHRLQFEVRVHSNLTVKEIRNMLEKVSMEDHSNSDMFAGKRTNFSCKGDFSIIPFDINISIFNFI